MYTHRPRCTVNNAAVVIDVCTQKFSGCYMIVAAASTIRAIESQSNGDVEVRELMLSHRNKTFGVKSCDVGCRVIRLTCSIQRSLYVGEQMLDLRSG